jgi:hypothetical protein
MLILGNIDDKLIKGKRIGGSCILGGAMSQFITDIGGKSGHSGIGI